MTVRTVAMLTAGGLAPCLSSAVGGLIERYTEVAPDVRLIAYTNGYAGLLRGDTVEVTPEVRQRAHLLHGFGGSPIGNSRVKLTNVADCVQRGLVQEGQDPLHVAAEQLTSDGVDVLHTIGGDDTNTTAADLAAYLHENGHDLTVVGLPKTVDNDIVPIRQSLGAWTAAAQGSVFAQNIVAEHSSNPRMLIVHEVMGRHCGWLTAATAEAYHLWVAEQDYVPAIGNDPRRWDVHGVFVPERPIDLHAEADRLRGVMDEIGCVNVFLSEGAGVSEVVAELEAAGQEVPARPVRPRPARQGQPRRVVRQAVRGAPRGREDDGAEVRLLLPLRRRERPRPRAHQGVHRPRRRLGDAGPAGCHRARRGARRRAASHRVPPDQGRQGVRHLGPLVHRPARVDRPGLTGEPTFVVDAWWMAVGVYAVLLVGQRLWRARTWVPPEWPEADYGWKVTHLFWVPFHVLDVVFGVPLLFAVVIAYFAI